MGDQGIDALRNAAFTEGHEAGRREGVRAVIELFAKIRDIGTTPISQVTDDMKAALPLNSWIGYANFHMPREIWSNGAAAAADFLMNPAVLDWLGVPD